MQQPLTLFHQQFSSMGCPCELQLYAASRKNAEAAIQQARNEIDRLDMKYSHYRENSEISIIQRRAARPGGTTVDRETAALLDFADTQFRLSEGLFDITARHLCAIWDRATSLPESTDISEALEKTGWEEIRWDGRRLEAPAWIGFDFGGIVKEYAADRAALILRKSGFRSGCIDLGGDLYLLGPHPDGKPWTAGIRNPDGSGKAIATVEVHAGGLASSGDYERFSTIDGKRFGHIINPKTGWPVSISKNCLAGVSAIAPSCLLAGSIATLAMLSGQEKGLDLLTDSGLPWLAIGADNAISGTLGPAS
jgi:thiamine biosynthesis lipoprotein